MSALAPASAFAPAKINLFLHVGDKRADGYHEICSLAAFADVGDTVHGEVADTLSLTLTGPFAAALEGDDDNLVLRAAQALQDWARDKGRKVDGARLTLHKVLPVASGIGGGSSDAAATLKLLNKIWRLGAGDADLAAIAAQLGADVPVCLRAQATLMQGIGEKLTPWPGQDGIPALLVNPHIAVMTADVFRGLNARTGITPPKHPDTGIDWLAACGNDLEAPARGPAPVIGDIVADLTATPGCRLARMSGSGATCFALFGAQNEAASAAAAFQHRYPHWWVVPTTLR